MAIVSTGQLTIVDVNDARSLSGTLTASQATQQVYGELDTQANYVPNWASSNLVLTPKVSISGYTTTQGWSRIRSRKFTLSPGGTAINASTTYTTATSNYVDGNGNGVTNPFAVANMGDNVTTEPTLTIAANLRNTVPSATIYFEAEYYDVATTYAMSFILPLTISVVKSGDGATYVVTRGANSIEESSSNTKNSTGIALDLVKPTGLDTSNLAYRFLEGGSTVIASGGSITAITTKYGFKSTTSPTAPDGTGVGAGIPALSSTGGWTGNNTLVISEPAVNDILVVKGEIYDTVGTYASDPVVGTTGAGSGATFTPVRVNNRLAAILVTAGGSGYNATSAITIDSVAGLATPVISGGVITAVNLVGQGAWSTYFTVYDLADPYDVQVSSNVGNIFRPGVNSAQLTPVVNYGTQSGISLTNWQFRWTLWDKNGLRGGLIDTGQPSGTITASTAVAANAYTTLTINPALSSAPAVGKLAKIVAANGDAFYGEVGGTPTTSAITFKAATGNNTWLTTQNNSVSIAAKIVDFFAGGKFYICSDAPVTGTGLTAGEFAGDATRYGGTKATGGSTAITVTGDDIDEKGRILCEANRP